MTTFIEIMNRQFPDINLSKPIAFLKGSDMDFISYSFFSALTMDFKKGNSLEKFKIFKKYLIDNAFITKNKKSIIINKFYKAQQCYYGFSKLAHLYKVKSSKIYAMDMDLYMSISLSELKSSQVLLLYDIITNTSYKFRLSDLINIINNNLSNAPDFFVESKVICNPYTNIPFLKSQLYTIYFKIKDSSFMMPLLFELYYCNNFDIEEFIQRNECIIRDYAIKSFLKGATLQQRYSNILKMLRAYNYLLDGIVIDQDFPKSSLVKAFNGYLEYYLITKYSLNPTLRFFSKDKLREKLLNFRKLNPTFGRKIIKNVYRQQITPQENQIIPYNPIGENGEFIFRATTDNFEEWNRQRQNTISFIDTTIENESESENFRVRRPFTRFPRSRATRRRLARLTILPSYNNIIDGSNDSSDEIEMETTSIENEQQENIENRTLINNVQNPLNLAVRSFLSVINSNHNIADT